MEIGALEDIWTIFTNVPFPVKSERNFQGFYKKKNPCINPLLCTKAKKIDGIVS